MRQPLLVVMCIALACAPVAAADDKWLAPDKAMHLAVGSGIGFFGTLATERRSWGTGLGCLAGIGKEVSDKKATGVFSYRDAVVTCIGAWVGSGAGAMLLSVTRNRIQITKEF